MAEDKLPLFVKRDNISARFEEIIASETSNRNLGIQTTFSPETITECSRKLIYRVMGDGKEVNFDYFKLSSDIHSRQKWAEYFSKFKFIKLLEEKLVVADCNYNISGVLDAVINMDDIIFAVKIFPINAERFLTIKTKGASRKDVIEVLVYMWLSETKNGLAVYENENTHEYFVFHIEPYKPIITAVKDKCLLLSEHKIKGVIPERPYKKNDSKECNGCEFINKCWRE